MFNTVTAYLFFFTIAESEGGGLLDGMGAGTDLETQLRILSLLENPAVVVAAAAANDARAMREFLVKHPSEVREGERRRK